MLRQDAEIKCIAVYAQTKLFIMHKYIYLSCAAEPTCIHTSIHFNMFIISLTVIIVAEVKKKGQDYLSYENFAPQPAMSLQRSTQP